jgi:hypothetical protein
MMKQRDVDAYFLPTSLKKQRISENQSCLSKPLKPDALYTTESLYNSLSLEDEENLTPKSLMSKRILADIKISGDKISEDLKKIKEIQMNLSKSHDDHKQPDLNIK